jgi:hypothetical protein
MSDDLIKRLGDPNRDWPEFGHDRREAKNRIEALEERNKELAQFVFDTGGQAADALDKLAEAGIVALETILNERGLVFDAMVDAAEDAAGKDVSFNVVIGRAIRAALAELEGKEC